MRTKYELEGLYRVARQRDFLDTFFPAEADIVAILTSMSSKRHYDGGIWKDLPNSPGQAETAYYRPLVEIANAIALQVGKNRDGIPKPIEDAGPIQGIWVVRASKSPDSSDPTAPKVRPNVCLVSNADHIVELDNRIDEEREKSEKDTARGLRRLNRERSIAVDELSIWWQHIHTCIEIKTRSDEVQREGAREQLCRYLKMSFKNQLDRRFVFGITLCHDLLDVYLCDRMGIIGMDVPINIHEDPKSFIRVVAGFSTLTATLLGWDPDMKVYLPDTGEAKRSYDPSLKIKYFREGTHSTQWVIELPEAEHEDLKRVVTIRAIGAVSAEMMSGRATVVWEVVRYNDIPVNVEQILILKRYWRPLVKPCEGKLYKKLKSHDERIIASGDARIGGSVDSTLEFIRHGIDVFEPYSVGSGHPHHQDAPKRDEARPESEAHLPQIVTAAGSPLSRSTASRVHAWVLLPFSGWVVRHFKDLPELLSVVLGGIKDHQEFFDAGILHRDVSIGNLLIAPAKISREDGKVQVVKTKAALIDLDHAKFTEEKAFIKRFSATPEDVGRIRDDVGVVDEEVSRKAITAVRRRHALDYIETVLLFRGLSVDSSRLLSCKDLHWTHDSDAREERPDYGRHIPWDGDHIGTHQYMSIEVASGNFARGYYHCTFGSGIKRRFIWSESVDGTIPNAGIGGFSHDMIHDIESFFWILVNLALTRRGPGLNMMREELDGG